VADEHDAVAALGQLGGHVVMKASSPAIQHKSELGAVILDLRAEDAVRGAYRRLAGIAAAREGTVLVERMAPAGLEVLLAAHTDAVTPALIVGLGGVWTEVLDDVAVVPLPCRSEQIAQALAGLRAAPMLAGARGGAPPDVASLSALAESIGELLLARGARLIECNPVVVWERGAMVLDAAIREVADA
jgi:succinyl-CoA synthetase beta subunit